MPACLSEAAGWTQTLLPTNIITQHAHMLPMRGLSQRNQVVILALVAILPVGILVATSVAGDVVNLVNPCFTWGAVSGGSITVSTGGPCSSAGATSETIPQMLERLAIIQGGILLGAGLGLLGVFGSRPILLVISSSILFLESIPLVFGGSFVLTLLPAVFFGWRAEAAGAFRK